MERQRLDVLLRSGIHWLFLGLFFFLPLLFYRHASEVFEFPKMLFVYAATVIICALWLGRMIVQKRLLIHKTPLDIPILLFLLSQVASTIYSIDPRTSWLGYYGRFHGGLWSTVSYTVLYYAFVSNRNKEQGTRNKFEETSQRLRRFKLVTCNLSLVTFISVILSSATLVSLYALLQHFGIDKNFWVQDVVNRVFSTQGQPNWLAAYLVMVIPLAFASGVTSDKLQVTSFRWLVPCSLFLVTLLFTKSRSGLIGLAIMDVVFWLVILCKPSSRAALPSSRVSDSESRDPAKRSKYLYRSARFLGFGTSRRPFARNDVLHFLLIHAMMAILILVTNNPAREWILDRLQVTGDRLQATTGPTLESGITLRKSEHGGTESGDIRRLVWSGAIQLMKQRPVFGFGPETFAYTYWWVRPAAHNLTSEWNFLYNKAHNEWLNLAANTGLFGLGSHLLLLGWFTIWTLKALKGPTLSTQGRTLSYAFLAALLGVEAVNFFGFSTVTVGAYTYLFMGLAVRIGTRDKPSSRAQAEGGQRLKEEQNGWGGEAGIVKRHASSVSDEHRNPHHDTSFANATASPTSLSSWPLAFSLAILVSAALYLLSRISIWFFADLSFARGRAYLENRYAFQALRPLEIAAELVPDEPTFRSSLAENEGLLAVSLNATGEQPDLAEKLKNESLQNFEIVEKQHPYSLSFLKTASRIVYSLGVFDPSLYDRGITLSKKAQQLAPTNPSIPYTIGVMLEAMEKNSDAKEFYQQALWLKPDYAEAVEKLDERTTQQNF